MAARLALLVVLAWSAASFAQGDAGASSAPDAGTIDAGTISIAAPPLQPAPAKSDPALDPDTVGPEEPNFGTTLLQMVLVLGIVIVVIYLTLHVGLRKVMGIRAIPTSFASVLQVLERVPLDQKRALFVVKAAGEYLLIGGGDNSLSLISKLDAEAVERLQREKPPPGVRLSPFLQKLLARKDGQPPQS